MTKQDVVDALKEEYVESLEPSGYFILEDGEARQVTKEEFEKACQS